jgi:RNA polymerase sigma-70 factor (ECF subfamily)
MQVDKLLFRTDHAEPGFSQISNMDNDQESALPDQELFIRTTIETNAKLGCELLFRRHYVELCSHAVRFLGSKAEAEDLVSEIFCTFYEKRVFATIQTSYRAYLFRAVRNRAYNYVRQNFHRGASLDDAATAPSKEDLQPDSITQYDELYQTVEKAIDSLPLQRRKVYLMNRFDGKSYADIAGELGISARTVEVHIRLATHALRDLLRYRLSLPCLITFAGLCLRVFSSDCVINS